MKAKKQPSVRTAQTAAYVRDAAVAEYTRRLADGQCDLCEKPAPFLNKRHDVMAFEVGVDMYRYIAEKDACNHAYARDGVRLPEVLSAMFGSGDRILGVAGWGFLLIPLVLLWILSWGIGRFVIWIVAGFHRLVRRRKGLIAH